MRGAEGGLRVGKRKGEGADLGLRPDANLEAELRVDRTANLAAMAAAMAVDLGALEVLTRRK